MRTMHRPIRPVQRIHPTEFLIVRLHPRVSTRAQHRLANEKSSSESRYRAASHLIFVVPDSLHGGCLHSSLLHRSPRSSSIIVPRADASRGGGGEDTLFSGRRKVEEEEEKKLGLGRRSLGKGAYHLAR